MLLVCQYIIPYFPGLSTFKGTCISQRLGVWDDAKSYYIPCPELLKMIFYTERLRLEILTLTLLWICLRSLFNKVNNWITCGKDIYLVVRHFSCAAVLPAKVRQAGANEQNSFFLWWADGLWKILSKLPKEFRCRFFFFLSICCLAPSACHPLRHFRMSSRAPCSARDAQLLVRTWRE